MAIDLDIDSFATAASLASAINASLTTQISSLETEVKSGLNSLVTGAGSNCDVFGGANGMARKASDSFKSNFKELTKNVQTAFSTVSEQAGSMIKSVTATLTSVKSKLAEFSSWLSTQADTVLASAQSVLNTLKTTINNALGAVSAAMNACTAYVTEIKNKMFEAVSALTVQGCTAIANAAKNIGTGAGIDSVVNTVSAINPGSLSEVALGGLTGSLGGIATSVNDLVGGIPNPTTTNGQLSSSVSSMNSLMGV